MTYVILISFPHVSKPIMRIRLLENATMKFLGRQQIEAAPAYCQPYSLADDEYLCEAAKAVGEATQLIESGFDCVQIWTGTNHSRSTSEKGIVPPKGPVV